MLQKKSQAGKAWAGNKLGNSRARVPKRPRAKEAEVTALLNGEGSHSTTPQTQSRMSLVVY